MNQHSTICSRPIRIPGSRPPISSAPMDTPVMEPYSTQEVLGGMMGAMVEDAAVTAAEKGLS